MEMGVRLKLEAGAWFLARFRAVLIAMVLMKRCIYKLRKLSFVRPYLLRGTHPHFTGSLPLFCYEG